MIKSNRIPRCNYEQVCESHGMDNDHRLFCIRCTRYIFHISHISEHDQNPTFLKDYSTMESIKHQ